MKKLLVMPILINSMLLSGCTHYQPRGEVKITPLSIKKEVIDENLAFVGNFILNNDSSKQLCVMQDIAENEFSPFVEVLSNRLGNKEGVPFPPKTNDVTKIPPMHSLYIRRVLGFISDDIDEKTEV